MPTLYRQFALNEIEGLGYFNSVEWTESVDSTNKRLAQSVRENSIALPALLVADEQTTGVGRGNNQWWSPSGCLMFSMAIPISPSGASTCIDSNLLPLRVGCAVAESLEDFSTVKPLVKWPNDVYLADRKVCGVLIEVIPGTSQKPATAIVGLGVNCRVDFRNAPSILQTNATSLHAWAKKEVIESVSTESVLVAFVHQWLELERRQEDDPSWLIRHWPKRSLLDGQWVEVKHGRGTSKGRCLGIVGNGAIRIQDEQLNIIEILAGTVESYRSLTR